ncbi:hypothetical protein HRG_001057 [Hirsutella rhossiliensis]|uniref:Uncharacterized protein n=1 Tax=Hirsutella rhossiliensis TaxID=111463 RepID=A0A9P8N7J0_9HYPO|nr:uncharacterized protein HRG_01057 [Hirsutella rhossiliensis]KAH0968415.1 hypothetical protein HRG_01057 [Hirsutella rhossiliensis]
MFAPERHPVSEAGPSARLRQRYGLAADYKQPDDSEYDDSEYDDSEPDDSELDDPELDDSEGTASDSDTPAFGPASRPAFGQDPVNVSEAFNCLAVSDLEASPEDAATSPDRTCRFDDEDAEYLSPDSELDWENAPFDYDVIFEASRGQTVPSEVGLPDGTPVLRAFVPRLARQVAGAIANQAQAVHGQVVDAYNGGVAGVGQAAQVAQVVAREVERNGLVMAQEALRLGNGISRMLQQRWPGLLRATGEDGWMDRVAEAVVQAAALMPPRERQMALARNGQR